MCNVRSSKFRCVCSEYSYTMHHHQYIAVFLLLICALIAVSSLNSNNDLVKMLQQVIVPSSFLPSPQSRPIVIITAFNLGFRWHLLNFDCFMKLLSLPYLAVSMDVEGRNWINQHNLSISTVFVPFHHELNVSTGTHTFRSHHYNVLTARKIRVVIEILFLGYDLFFVDPDAALLRNPFPHLLWNNVDYVHSLNDKCNAGEGKWSYFHNHKIEGNTGLYFIRSTPTSLQLVNESYQHMKATHFKTDDQTYFWHFLRANETIKRVLPLGKCRHIQEADKKQARREGPQKKMALCALDPCLFTVGTVHNYLHEKYCHVANLTTANYSSGDHLIAVHANFINGIDRKMQQLDLHGLWLHRKDMKCAVYAGAESFCHYKNYTQLIVAPVDSFY